MSGGSGRCEDAPIRVLVAEDEFLVYLALEEELRANGYDVVGPCANLGAIRAALASEAIDCALLDINLCGELVYPVADELLARRVPFLFLSGYASAAVPEGYRHILRLEKPYDPVKLATALRQLARALAPQP